MQELALLAVMQWENEEEAQMEEARFRSQIIAAHPDRAKEILDILDRPEEEFAEELSEEEMEDYVPFSAEEAQATVDMLRRFGVAVR